VSEAGARGRNPDPELAEGEGSVFPLFLSVFTAASAKARHFYFLGVPGTEERKVWRKRVRATCKVTDGDLKQY
jgi:hypothetical protein